MRWRRFLSLPTARRVQDLLTHERLTHAQCLAALEDRLQEAESSQKSGLHRLTTHIAFLIRRCAVIMSCRDGALTVLRPASDSDVSDTCTSSTRGRAHDKAHSSPLQPASVSTRRSSSSGSSSRVGLPPPGGSRTWPQVCSCDVNSTKLKEQFANVLFDPLDNCGCNKRKRDFELT